jgi:hypothetical protein
MNLVDCITEMIRTANEGREPLFIAKILKNPKAQVINKT